MPTYAVYDTTTNVVRFVTAQKNPPTFPTTSTYAAVAVVDGFAMGTAKWSVVAGAVTPYVNSFADNQLAAVTAAQAVYDGIIAAGFTWQGVLYQIDPTSQSNMAAMALAALGTITDPADNPAWPSGFTWIAANNTQVPMTAAQMYAFARAVAGYVSAVILNLRAIKTAILATTAQAALVAIDVTAGYPAAAA